MKPSQKFKKCVEGCKEMLMVSKPTRKFNKGKFNVGTKKAFRKTFKKMVRKKLPPSKLKGALSAYLTSVLRAQGLGPAQKMLLQLAGNSFVLKVANAYAQVIEAPDNDVIGFAGKTTAVSETSQSRVKGQNNVTDYTHYKLKFETGKPATRGNLAVAKVNGTNKRVYADTIRDNSLTAEQRALWTQECGFNQKNQFILSATNQGFSLNDMKEIFGLDEPGLKTSNFFTQRSYACIQSMTTKFKITNNMSYTPATLKIHFFRYKQEGESYLTLLDRCCNIDINVQENGKMPAVAQLALPISNVAVDSVLVDPNSGGIMASDIWSSNCEVVKSFTQKIAPLDILDFTYIQHCGSGLRLDTLFGMLNDGDSELNIPIGYGILFEVMGNEVEAHANDNFKVRYIGTAPASVSLQMKKYLFGAPSSRNVSEANTWGGYFAQWAIRTYTSDLGTRSAAGSTPGSAIANRIFNMNMADIGTPITGITIPVVSSGSIDTVYPPV